MKRIILIMAASFLLTSCGGSEVSATGLTDATGTSRAAQPAAAVDAEAAQPVATESAAAEAEAAPANADGFICVYDEKNVYMDEDMTAVLEKLGEPKSTFEAPSCAFEGIDKIFSYAGANIHTYPAEGADFVHTIHYMDDSIATPEGVRLGNSLADVTAAYGEDYTEELGQYTYVKNATYLRFLIKDDMVIDITYGLTEYMEQI